MARIRDLITVSFLLLLLGGLIAKETIKRSEMKETNHLLSSHGNRLVGVGVTRHVVRSTFKVPPA